VPELSQFTHSWLLLVLLVLCPLLLQLLHLGSTLLLQSCAVLPVQLLLRLQQGLCPGLIADAQGCSLLLRSLPEPLLCRMLQLLQLLLEGSEALLEGSC
jgi:hypothetical protein